MGDFAGPSPDPPGSESIGTRLHAVDLVDPLADEIEPD